MPDEDGMARKKKGAVWDRTLPANVHEKAKTIREMVGWGGIVMAKGMEEQPQPTLRLPARSASPFENQPIDHMGKS